MFDIYTDIAAYMTWIGTTIKKMGGMLACDLAIEETNPEGHYFVFCDGISCFFFSLNEQNLVAGGVGK